MSQVCTHWRNIVAEMPILWSSINVDFEHRYNIHTPLNMYLSRSRGLPLKLRIAFSSDAHIPSWGFDVWELLSENIWRSRELAMAMECCFIDNLRPIQHLTFPHLESFHERVTLPGGDTWPWFWQAIQGALNLVRFFTESWDLHNRLVPFSQLTSCEAPDTWDDQLEDFLEILKKCHCLRLLTLGLSHSMGESPAVARDVKLPSLRRLSVNAFLNDRNWLSSVFQSLDMPSLRVLNLYFTWPLPPSLLDMVRRSSPSLKQMLLSAGSFSPEGDLTSSVPILFDVLQAASELTHLLTELKDSSRDFLPKLSLLSLKVPVTLNTQLVEQVLEVLETRHGTSHPLTSFSLMRTFSGAQVDERYVVERESMIERMELLASRGVKVIIQDRATVKP
ncbi:hypothetical protein L218DRAFT_1002527 [Marasmius fiardii PR-910]|nr:hypothetical protein L218DRAFT_1002527 [Marasmius fiardii PR-910]